MRLLVAAAVISLVVAQNGGTIRQIDLTLTEGTSIAAAVSPDQRWIAFDLVGSLWVMPLRGGEARQITPPLLEARLPAWSPDSQSIAFQGYDDGTWHVYVIDRDGGEARALTSGEFDDREPAWSHHGSRIAFSSDRYGGIVTLWEVDAANGQVRQISKRDAWMPSWSPNDQEILAVSGDRFTAAGDPVPDRVRRAGLWTTGFDGHERLLVDAKDQGLPAAAAWSKDGTQLAFTTVSGTIQVGGQIVQPGEDVFPFRPQWISPTEVVYTADGHIKRRTIGGTRVVPFTAKVPLRRAVYPIAHRDIEPSRVQPVKGIVAPAVSPDGHAIAFVALGDLWVMLDGEQPVRVTNDEAVELDPAWSPDGRELAYSSDRAGHMDLWVHNFAANSDTQVTHARGAVSGAAWSPDGSHIAYLVDGRGFAATRVRPGDGLGGGPVSDGQEIGRPTWSPDSRAIATGALFHYSDRYREGLNQLRVYSFESGASWPSVLLPGHSAGNRQTGGPVWSPDGAQMAVVSEGVLWSVGVDARGIPNSAPFAITDDQPESPSWERDSRHLVYQTPTGFRRVAAAGGTPEPIPVALEWRPERRPSRIVVHVGGLFDGVLDGLRGESDIVIDNGIVREVAAHRDDLHVGTVVNAPDEIAIPGLIEMHAHLDADYGGAFGRAWLAYGITSVRLAAVNPYAALELRESFDSGRRPGPRIFMAGDPFDGARIYYPGGVSVTSDAQLERELDRANALGVDFFKTYVRLPDRLQKRIVDYAHDLGKPVTSHEIFPAVAFGVDGVEHLRGTSRRGYSPKASTTNRAYQDVVDAIVKSGMTITPTIGIQGAFNARMTGDRSIVFDERLGLYPLAVVSRLTDLASGRSDPALDARIKGYEATIKAIASGGGRIIAGTDAPIDPYGLGLHVELESYVHAGLTPLQALQTATINAAQALGLEGQLGTIEPGKIADLTLVAGNPLEDIRHTRDVKHTIKGGRVYAVRDLIKR
jgi:Tol biopolymer transport system component/imidazolonepropionase-like amidohydrolase